MLNVASQILKKSVSEIRSNVATLAHQISKAGHAKTQSEAWKMAWNELRKIVESHAPKSEIKEKCEAIMNASHTTEWEYSFCLSIENNETLTQKQETKLSELYAQI